MTPYEAGQQLGTLLFGNRGSTSSPDGTPSLADAVTGRSPEGSVYYKTLTQGATAQNAMQSARLNRAKALIAEGQQAARQGYKQAYIAAGGAPSLADLATDSFVGATTSNPTQAFGLLAQGRATNAANVGDDASLNRNIAAFAGKPLELSATNGGITTANPYTSPAVAPNAVGTADIAAKNAAAAASYASADRQRAGIGVDKAANYDITQDALGDIVRVNKLTGQLTPVVGPSGPAKGAAKNTIPTPEQLGQYFPPGDNDPTGAKYSQAEWDAWRQAEAQRGVTNYGQMLEDFVTQGAKYVPGKPATEGTGTLGNIVHHIFGGTNEAPAAAVPAHFDTSGAPTLGDAALTAKPLPSNVKIIPAPGTDPGVVAAMQAAAAAGHNAPAQTGDAPVTPTTQAEFDALPPGTLFVNPADGKTYRKK